MQRVLFIIGNYYPELTGIGKYNKEMTEWMADNGFEVTVISTYPYYPQWRIQKSYRHKHKWYSKEHLKTAQGNTIQVYRCPHYVPKAPTAFKRVLLDVSFFLSAFLQVLKLAAGKKFEYVITVTPPLLLGLLGVLYKSIVRKSKLFYHIQDLQIEAARDLQMIKSRSIINSLFRIENYIMQNSNVISSISEGMIEKIKIKTKKEVLLFPNWADLNLIYPIADKAGIKEEFGFKSSDKIVLYSGSIGEKQGLEAILYAAVKQKDSNVKFVICGSGPYMKNLQLLAEEQALENVVFLPLQPLEKFNRFLNMADIHLIIQKSNASDLVMPSKLTNILAVGGVALVTADKGCTLHHIIDKYKMGLLVKAESAEALYHGITKALTEPMDSVKANALLYAQRYLSIDSIMDNYFLQAIAQAVPQSRVITNRDLHSKNDLKELAHGQHDNMQPNDKIHVEVLSMKKDESAKDMLLNNKL